MSWNNESREEGANEKKTRCKAVGRRCVKKDWADVGCNQKEDKMECQGMNIIR